MDDPEATIKKAQQIRRAALAPSEPSSQDRSVANQAAAMEAKARAELMEEKTNGDSGVMTKAKEIELTYNPDLRSPNFEIKT
ncbi:MAG: putative metalloprotease CJM1_0395 family protein [Ignavibacteria bacterium]|jgi:hypothetical protein